jgi:RNA polymerase sigma factor (sigma-70 family)
MSEKKLWNDLRAGDKNALEAIYRSYFSDLYTYGKRFTQDENTVEDCIQELYIELWNRRDKLSETDAIRPYLYISLKRKIFYKVKNIRKTTETPLEESHFEIELAIDQILINKESSLEKSENLKKAFEQLSSRQKEILYLKYYSGMDYDEISEVMDLNYQSARNLVSRAITKLSKFILLYFICMNIMKQII